MKNVVVRVKAEAFGMQWAAQHSTQQKYMGVIEKWQDPDEKTKLLVLWEGSSRRQTTELDSLKTDTQGNDLPSSNFSHTKMGELPPPGSSASSSPHGNFSSLLGCKRQ